MIFDIFLSVWSIFLSALIWVLPTWSLPAMIDISLRYVIHAINVWNNVLPVTTLLTCFIIVLMFESVYLVARVAVWVLNFFRGSGGSPMS